MVNFCFCICFCFICVFFSFIAALDGGTLWHFQRFLQCIKHIMLDIFAFYACGEWILELHLYCVSSWLAYFLLIAFIKLFPNLHFFFLTTFFCAYLYLLNLLLKMKHIPNKVQQIKCSTVVDTI
jgi:hypothetical protein